MTDDAAPRVTVRRAVEEDDGALLAIDKTAWDASSGFPSYQETLQDSFFARSGPDAHLVAEYGGAVVGYVRLENKYKFPEGAGVLGINGLAVAETARRRGVANALMEAATAEAHRRGARKLTLHVHMTNAPAVALYKQHGYTIEGTHPSEFLIDGVLIGHYTMAKLLQD
ncbi:GNAT family N-acetyltransferase [Kribbella sp. NPDC026611]|uniref:GNAT family N-acetyltransferase n=1 Tax=Kribbella sp. NPDC026611 TaxID=3154911 RepID=UPI0033C16F59